MFNPSGTGPNHMADFLTLNLGGETMDIWDKHDKSLSLTGSAASETGH